MPYPYTTGFPASYQPLYPPGYYPQQPQPQPQPQAYTAPTIRAEIVQVENEAAAEAYPVGAGGSQMMIARDEGAIYIKTALANGQTSLTIYDKRPPAPPAPVFDPAEYVRKDELRAMIATAMAQKQQEASEA